MDDSGPADANAPVRSSPSDASATRTVRPSVAERLAARGSRRIVWAAVCLVLAGFVAFGRVTVYVADGDERRLSILRVWSLQGNGLPSVDHATLVSALFVSSLVVLIVTSLTALWLALVSVGPAATEVGPPPLKDDTESLAAADEAAGLDRT